MELLAQEEGKEPIIIDTPLTDLVAMGYLQEEARELQTSYTSFPRVSQKLWPIARADGIIGQHVNITQLPFDVETDMETGLSKDYHVILHFEKSKTTFIQEQITKKVLICLEKMKIEVGEDIGDPIAVLCHTNTKAWSGMVKLHLKNPEINAFALLHGIRPFVLELNDQKPVIAKIAKGYDIIAKSSLVSVRIDSDSIKTSEAHHLFKTIVEKSFTCRHQFEITKVTKRVGDDFTWIATTSPEQLLMIEGNKVSIYGELLQPSIQSVESLTEDELVRRKCLLLITKNLNQVKGTEMTEASICEHIGTELVTSVYFPHARGTTHSGVANVECVNAIVYKQHVRKSARILGKYVTFHPHPKSLDGSLKPNETTLKKLGFLDVNATLANTVESHAEGTAGTQEEIRT